MRWVPWRGHAGLLSAHARRASSRPRPDDVSEWFQRHPKWPWSVSIDPTLADLAVCGEPLAALLSTAHGTRLAFGPPDLLKGRRAAAQGSPWTVGTAHQPPEPAHERTSRPRETPRTTASDGEYLGANVTSGAEPRLPEGAEGTEGCSRTSSPYFCRPHDRLFQHRAKHSNFNRFAIGATGVVSPDFFTQRWPHEVFKTLYERTPNDRREQRLFAKTPKRSLRRQGYFV